MKNAFSVDVEDWYQVSDFEEVVDFYDHGITATPNLHPALRDAEGQPLRLGLSAEDRAALVAFLRTLTDTAVGDDPRFADPFPRR